jgi:phosphatidylinositol 4-kinase
MRLLQFLGSHFNASRLGSPNSEKAFLRLLTVTLDGLKNSTGHPLAREIRFHVVLFGLKVLRHSTVLDISSKYLLKDQILSAALSWFTFAPRWSFGGNRLQLKAEARLLSDVSAALRNVTMPGQKPNALPRTLQSKETLLLVLLESEQTRLLVWLYPLNGGRESPQSAKPPSEVSLASSKLIELKLTRCKATLLGLVQTAWNESPSLAVQLIARFPSAKLLNDIRVLLLHFPEKAISEPEAVQLLLGSSLPSDLSFQLKVCLWISTLSLLTDTHSTYYTGPPSTQSQLLLTSCRLIAITRSFCNMLCALWRVTPLMLRSFMFLRLYKPCDTTVYAMLRGTLWRPLNSPSSLHTKLSGT